jgi:hypothetical protein
MSLWYEGRQFDPQIARSKSDPNPDETTQKLAVRPVAYFSGNGEMLTRLRLALSRSINHFTNLSFPAAVKPEGKGAGKSVHLLN